MRSICAGVRTGNASACRSGEFIDGRIDSVTYIFLPADGPVRSHDHLYYFIPEARLLLDYGCGITSAVARPTVRATDLSRADYIAARPAFERKITKYRPRYLAFLGKPACAVFLNQRDLSWGLQSTTLGGSAVWVLPSPSGLNRAFTIGKLTDAYRDLFEAAALRGQ
ncbi:MAG: uracil-DNA glycosylase family protein [Terracidiphilus sp.]